jgi:hypothetical protein
MTQLTKKVSRLSNHRVQGRRIAVTLVPGTEKRHDLVALRQHGRQTQYLVPVADIYRWGALIYANKVKAAKAEARRNGIPWRQAKKQFARDNNV